MIRVLIEVTDNKLMKTIKQVTLTEYIVNNA